MKAVELHQAFSWTCDACGRDNFARAVTVAPESIDPDDLPEVAGMDAEALHEWIESGGDGAWLMAPQTVTCEYCGESFKTTEGEDQ